jgi:hypothetical protein
VERSQVKLYMYTHICKHIDHTKQRTSIVVLSGMFQHCAFVFTALLPAGCLLVKGEHYRHDVTGTYMLCMGFMRWACIGMRMKEITLDGQDFELHRRTLYVWAKTLVLFVAYAAIPQHVQGLP